MVAFLAFGLVVTFFTSSLPNSHVALIPLSTQSERQPFRPAGLRGQASLMSLQTNEESSSSSLPRASLEEPNYEEDGDSDVDEGDLDHDHDPQYIMPLRKFLGTRQQAVQREHHEIHDQVQDHVFGQNRSGSSLEIEEDPSVVIKDWESDGEADEEKIKKVTEADEEKPGSASKEEDEPWEENH